MKCTASRRLTIPIFSALLALLLVTPAMAESVWVKAEVADIRQGKAAVYPAVGQVKKGQELSVLSHDGKWVQVQVPAGGPSGWINEVSVSSQKVGGDLLSMPPGAAAANMSTGIAARGLQGDAEAYVQARHLSKQPLEYLIALRKSIPPQEYEAFTSQGKVGAH